jgi:hypothetical protein
MKTAQILQIPFELGTFPINHKTGMGRLQDFISLGNEYRRKAGKSPIQLTHWLNRIDVKEYVEYLESQGLKSIEKKGGRKGGTWGSLDILISLAMDMSPKFKHEVISTFINNKALEYRDQGGSNFIELNETLSLNAELVLGKPAHKGHYITLARIMKKRCGVENWNACDPNKLAIRCQLEDRLATMLKANVVRDWDHLKELAEKV